MRADEQAFGSGAPGSDFARFEAARSAFAGLTRAIGRRRAEAYAARASLALLGVCANYRADFAGARSAAAFHALVEQVASDAEDTLRLDSWVMDEFGGRDEPLEAALAYTHGQVIPFVQCFVGSDARLVRG